MDAYEVTRGKLQHLVEEFDYLHGVPATEDVFYSYYDEFKGVEQALMLLMDEYAEVARAMGVPCGGFFDDPKWTHEEIVARAKELYETSKDYDELLCTECRG